MTVFSDTYDTATPAGSDDPAEADDRMREIKAAVQERENVDHYWPFIGTEVSDADTGEHKKVTLRTGSAPAAVADKGIVYAKDVGGKAELFYIDEDSNEVQITTAGILNSLNLTGTQTAAGAKTFSGVVVVGDTSALATSGAPAADAQIANKKYVDDNVGPANYTPTSYAGEESVTLPNGLIMKFGSASFANGGTLTYGTAFPTAVMSLSVNLNGASGNLGANASSTTTTLTVFQNQGGSQTVHWMAIGY